jgi:hypothetical protein
MSDDVNEILSVVYEMPNLGTKVVPFNSSKSIKDFFDAHPESSYTVFSKRTIDEIADIYDKIVFWISSRQISIEEFNENIAELDSFLEEKLISNQRYELILLALKSKFKDSQQREEDNA